MMAMKRMSLQIIFTEFSAHHLTAVQIVPVTTIEQTQTLKLRQLLYFKLLYDYKFDQRVTIKVNVLCLL